MTPWHEDKARAVTRQLALAAAVGWLVAAAMAAALVVLSLR